MKNTFVILSIIFVAFACNRKKESGNFLFDMGNSKDSVQTGYLQIHAEDAYDSSKGFGWLQLPKQNFDSANLKLPYRILHDGLTGDRMSFRADIPNGDYFLRVYLGMPPQDTTMMQVSVNGNILPDTAITPWYRLPYKTISTKVNITDGKLILGIVSLSNKQAGIYGLELRAVTKTESIKFQTELEQDTTEIKVFRDLLEQKIIAEPNNIAVANQLQNVRNYLQACTYYNGGGWSWAVKGTGLSLIYRLYAAADLLQPIILDDTDPLYHKSLYLLAKIYYWLDQEDSDLYHSVRFHEYFSSLREKYPDNELLKMYTGEKIFDKPVFDTVAGKAPLWAVYQRETMYRMLKVIHWWVNDKQTENGEMGGKYGDDVELLRWWLPAILGAADSTALKGYKRLADGVWNSDALERGFAKHVDDVEHSAELFRDTHPAMFLMNYGDPEYVERCLISMQNFRDVWTGTTPMGHLHFKSYYLSATEALSNPPYNIDVALNARALLPGLWAAWYNRNPSLLKLFSSWSNAWVDDSRRTDNGKPAGLLPSAVSFPEDLIGGSSKEWYDAHLTYDYYQWDHIGHVCELQNHILGLYAITHDKNLLAPVNYYASIMKTAAQERDKLKGAAPGSLDWAKYLLIGGGVDHEKSTNPMGKTFALAKYATNESKYDSLILNYASPYNRYLLTHDKKEIISGFDQILSGIRYNYPLSTSEVKFTDRVYMPGSDLLMGMYTGHLGAGYEYPALVASWQNTGPDISIFVRGGDKESAEVSLYNFGPEKTIQMRSWQLEPGVYVVKQGIDNNDDDIADEQISEQTIELKERVNTIELKIPSHKTLVISIHQAKSFGPASVNEPDLAIAPADIKLSNTNILSAQMQTINCRIHNIGNRVAKNTEVILSIDGKETGRTVISSLEAPNDLTPRWTEVKFDWMPVAGSHKIEVQILSANKEITKSNNFAEKIVDVGSK